MEEIAVFETLKHLCDGRVYPDHLPHDTPFPAIRYVQVGGRLEYGNCGNELSTPRIQIDVYANHAVERYELEQLVRDAMANAADLGAVLQSVPAHLYEYDLKIYRAILDYLIYV